MAIPNNHVTMTMKTSRDAIPINLEILGDIPTISIECDAGTFFADVETVLDTPHNAIFLRFQPKDSTDSIDIAMLRDTPDPEKIEFLTWKDFTSEDPDSITEFKVSEIRDALT